MARGGSWVLPVALHHIRLRQGYSQNLEPGPHVFVLFQGWQPSPSNLPVSILHPALELQAQHVGAGDPNSGPDACTASTLTH